MLEIKKIIISYVTLFLFYINIGNLNDFNSTAMFPFTLPVSTISGLMKTKPVRKTIFKVLTTRMMHAIAINCNYEWDDKDVDYYLYEKAGITLDIVYREMERHSGKRIAFLQDLVDKLPKNGITFALRLKIEAARNRDIACAVLMEILGWMLYFDSGHMSMRILVNQDRHKYYFTNCISFLIMQMHKERNQEFFSCVRKFGRCHKIFIRRREMLEL